MSELPDSWRKTVLEPLIIHVLGGDWGKENTDEVPEEFSRVKVIRGTEFKNWQIEKGTTGVIRLVKSSSLAKRKLNENDIVVEVSGGGPTQPVGRAVLIDKEALEKSQYSLVCSNFFRQVRLSDNIQSCYISYFINYANQVGISDDFQTQTTNLRNLNFNDFISKLEIPLPPLNEQRRIVAKLEKLLAKCEASKQRLDKIPHRLKQFRQSILAAACSGRLTADWRTQHPNTEPVSELLKGIRQKRAKEHGKSGSRKPLEHFEILDIGEDLPELPKTWQWVAMGNYAECSRGRFSVRPRNDPRYYDGQYPFIQIGDLPREGGSITGHQQTLNEDGLSVSKMFPKGTVAIAIVGATIGNTGILSYDMCFPDSLVGIQTNSDIGNYYLDYYLRSEKEKIRTISYAGGGQPNIKLQTLNPYPFPLPPLEEQKEIVKRVEKLFKRV